MVGGEWRRGTRFGSPYKRVGPQILAIVGEKWQVWGQKCLHVGYTLYYYE